MKPTNGHQLPKSCAWSPIPASGSLQEYPTSECAQLDSNNPLWLEGRLASHARWGAGTNSGAAINKPIRRN
jgi:hypothetical protein